MTESIVYILGIFLFVMIFALGFILGHHRAETKPLMPVAPEKHDPPPMDDEERLRIEENEKAFQACMNYNIESAYQMGGK